MSVNQSLTDHAGGAFTCCKRDEIKRTSTHLETLLADKAGKQKAWKNEVGAPSSQVVVVVMQFHLADRPVLVPHYSAPLQGLLTCMLLRL